MCSVLLYTPLTCVYISLALFLLFYALFASLSIEQCCTLVVLVHSYYLESIDFVMAHRLSSAWCGALRYL